MPLEIGRGAGPQPSGLLVEVGGRGQVLGGQAERFEHGDLVVAGAARGCAGEQLTQLGQPVTAYDQAPAAVDGADIVVTATSSSVPVLRREWLAPGTHVNAVGACVPGDRELDTAIMAEAAVFADSRESVSHEAGDFLLAQGEGVINPVRAELGDLLTGTAPGRADADEITVFESLGLAAEDLAAASFLYQKAARLGVGTAADF